MLKKTQTVSFLLLSLALSFGGNVYASEVGTETSITQQAEKITGTIEDEFGPVTGASVVVKGTTNGTVTDMNGKFSLSNVKKGDVIVISFIGYFVIALPVSYICGFVLNGGIEGIWVGYPVGLTLTGAMLCWRFYYFLRKRKHSKF